MCIFVIDDVCILAEIPRTDTSISKDHPVTVPEGIGDAWEVHPCWNRIIQVCISRVNLLEAVVGYDGVVKDIPLAVMGNGRIPEEIVGNTGECSSIVGGFAAIIVDD